MTQQQPQPQSQLSIDGYFAALQARVQANPMVVRLRTRWSDRVQAVLPPDEWAAFEQDMRQMRLEEEARISRNGFPSLEQINEVNRRIVGGEIPVFTGPGGEFRILNVAATEHDLLLLCQSCDPERPSVYQKYAGPQHWVAILDSLQEPAPDLWADLTPLEREHAANLLRAIWPE